MDIVAIMNEVHQTAVEHGWWDSERDPREAFALMHSKLSEALEEARQGHPMYYSNPDNPAKPEGIGIELIDFVIRALDFMGHFEVPYIEKSKRGIIDVSEDALPIMIFKVHAVLDAASIPDNPMLDFDTGKFNDKVEIGFIMSAAIDMIFGWLRAHGASPEAFLKEKAEFNKSRPYKHGKQF